MDLKICGNQRRCHGLQLDLSFPYSLAILEEGIDLALEGRGDVSPMAESITEPG